tara:strand:+ start:180 stop:326 length:147 start_codon:yes stop_codon:yes gene_type:complete
METRTERRITKFVTVGILIDCIAFAGIMITIIYGFPLALAALGVWYNA